MVCQTLDFNLEIMLLTDKTAAGAVDMALLLRCATSYLRSDRS
jgi:hypothetical protein